MAQLAIYLDNKMARVVHRMAKRSGLSRSEWVSRVLKKELEQKIPEVFFQILGSWEDERPPREIFREIRRRSQQRERTLLK